MGKNKTVTTDDVKKLRTETGLSVMECKKALEEAKGDMDKAKVILSKKGGAVAAKKADRELGAGVISAYVHGSKDVGSVVILSCETDFVAKNQEFISLAYDIAMHITAQNPLFLKRDDVSDKDMKAAREVFENEVKGKEKKLQDTILKGKLDAYFKDKILLEQSFIKDPNRTIRDLLEGATQKFGERIQITRFERFSVRG